MYTPQKKYLFFGGGGRGDGKLWLFRACFIELWSGKRTEFSCGDSNHVNSEYPDPIFCISTGIFSSQSLQLSIERDRVRESVLQWSCRISNGDAYIVGKRYS